MNKETNLFNPVDLELSRSTFEYHPTVSGTAMAGRLYPAFAFEVLPGDSIKMDLNTLIKMSTPVYPTMDRLYLDVAFFFVPNRLVLGRRYGSPAVDDETHSWKSFIGAQDNLLNCPIPAEGVELPKFKVDPSGSYLVGSIADCLGYPINNDDGSVFDVNCLEVLSYVAIYNENFRDPNTSEPVTWSIDANNRVNLKGTVPTWVCKAEAGTNNYTYLNALKVSTLTYSTVSDALDVGNMKPFATSRFHGYFGSCLPWPQRNSVGVELPLGKDAPVVTGQEHIKNGDVVLPTASRLAGYDSITGNFVVSGIPGASNVPQYNSSGAWTYLGAGTKDGDASSGISWQFTNLYADLSQATAANVNALRLAVQKQRWYEKLARSGNRFDELEYGLFGVRPHDSGDDRPLYLGGKRIPLSIEMVASTQGGTSPSGSEGAGSLGALGAFSHTNDSDHYFYHSFDEWGTLMCVFTIRHHTTVDNRLKRSLIRKTKFDYYWPTFAHLGEMAVWKSEIAANDAAIYGKDEVFGYQEAWAEYRYEPDVVTGLLRTSGSLAFMTYAEKFDAFTDTLASYLNASRQIKSVDNTLAVKSYASGFQFVYQFNFDFIARRPMPQYSIPGLVDHF